MTELNQIKCKKAFGQWHHNKFYNVYHVLIDVVVPVPGWFWVEDANENPCDNELPPLVVVALSLGRLKVTVGFLALVDVVVAAPGLPNVNPWVVESVVADSLVVAVVVWPKLNPADGWLVVEVVTGAAGFFGDPKENPPVVPIGLDATDVVTAEPNIGGLAAINKTKLY